MHSGSLVRLRATRWEMPSTLNSRTYTLIAPIFRSSMSNFLQRGRVHSFKHKSLLKQVKQKLRSKKLRKQDLRLRLSSLFLRRASPRSRVRQLPTPRKSWLMLLQIRQTWPSQLHQRLIPNSTMKLELIHKTTLTNSSTTLISRQLITLDSSLVSTRQLSSSSD